MTQHNIGEIDDFPSGRGVDVDVGGLEITVFNLDGDLHAISSRCPHKGAPFSRCGEEKRPPEQFSGRERYRGHIDADSLMITCPWHSLRFDLETGDCPATRDRIRTFAVEVDGGDVFVEV